MAKEPILTYEQMDFYYETSAELSLVQSQSTAKDQLSDLIAQNQTHI